EVSKRLSYQSTNVNTPLGNTTVQQLADQVVVGSIMRAGLPMHQGVLDVFDHAQSCFISAFRKYISADSFNIDLQYVATPNLDGKVLLLNDPMLATGSSLALTYEALKKFGTPKHTHLMSIIAAQPGVDYIAQAIKDNNITLWIAAVDPDLNAHKYIVPGLGDAGDLAFGEKL
ncbi:MAG: uracil phosphoribosyltransferase, partial [Oscillospiraceae bacterium]|nr:uracil phosphoribosyltransferase [Oscillospiraceae bacterium]